MKDNPQNVSQLIEILENRTPIIEKLGFPLSRLPLLKEYLSLVWKANAELNLFSRKMSMEELVDNHLIDCLLPLEFFPTAAKAVADFGSGGGFPGVIYALAFPNLKFHLYEKSPKKQNFLKSCQQRFRNIEVFGEIPTDLPDVDFVTSRAFKPLDVLFEISRDYFRRGGSYFLLKGRHEKIQEELAFAQKKFGNISIQVLPLHSPVLDVERHLVLIG